MKILMVCLGNICRSPLAHGIVEYLATEQGLEWSVDSAGTGNWHVGQAPDPRAIKVARNNGIDISTQRAQHFQPHFFDHYDLIFVMDRQNLQDVLALAESDRQRQKVSLFIENDVVPDPYYDDDLFDPVFSLIYRRSVQIIGQLQQS
ncbi:MAG TPA: low molecular weight protein-tyrosine-phosphatase [Sphingobacteriaceae bacterium]|nr:low molecular weight protein-tyrosine-phosphatase [Sphingobacteriaceae bacterium]